MYKLKVHHMSVLGAATSAPTSPYLSQETSLPKAVPHGKLLELNNQVFQYHCHILFIVSHFSNIVICSSFHVHLITENKEIIVVFFSASLDTHLSCMSKGQ